MTAHSPRHSHGCGCHSAPPVRHCRQEPKELLVLPEKLGDFNPNTGLSNLPISDALRSRLDAAAAEPVGTGIGRAIVGGGCCVQFSVEYMPAAVSLKEQECTVLVDVIDSEGSSLVWSKKFSEGYHVQEYIITSYPGARLIVLVDNAIARVRWCEVFSC